MKRSHFLASLGALTIAFLLPIAASAMTTQSTSSTKATTTAKKSEATSSKSHHLAMLGAKRHPRKIDVNTASREQLMTLPGIDGSKADRIIADRPFKTPRQLVTKDAVSKKEYSRIRRDVTVR